MKIIGLTGPMGAGKSEVAKIFARRGAYIIDADEIGHDLFVPQSDIWCQIVRSFGKQVLTRSGSINRKKLGMMVFSDPKKIKSLNAITHPAIKRKIEEEIAKKSWRGRLVVINAALPELFKGLVDKTVVVSASDHARLTRLIKNGLSKSEAQKRMKAQMPMKKYLSIADIVIKNDSAKNNLETEVKELLLS